jgi:hypothetical protein
MRRLIPVEILHQALNTPHTQLRTTRQNCLNSYYTPTSSAQPLKPSTREKHTMSVGVPRTPQDVEHEADEFEDRDDERAEGNGPEGEC